MRSEAINIGILSLQGAFAAHAKALLAESTYPISIRYPDQLKQCRGLILPGGESTSQKIIGQQYDWLAHIAEFAKRAPLFGTCAGIIIMSQLGLLDIEIERNGFGTQKESFQEKLKVHLPDRAPYDQTALFIRAPRIKKCGAISILANLENKEAVCVQQGKHLGCTFHPELCTPSILHRYFIQQCVLNEPTQDLIPL